jgi:hypothetical protein
MRASFGSPVSTDAAFGSATWHPPDDAQAYPTDQNVGANRINGLLCPQPEAQLAKQVEQLA